MRKKTVLTLSEMKAAKQKIAVLTCYDFAMAKILAKTDIDVLLVGDSLGMVKLGYANTLPVTMEDMISHCASVRRGAPEAFIICDMPFMSYESSVSTAVENAGRLIKEGCADAVKLEGGREMAETVEAIVNAKIPVAGHVGLMPQAVNAMGGYKIQGKCETSSQKIFECAAILEESGASLLFVECVPSELAQKITQKVNIPVIGIGSGKETDGQVLVLDDMLGLNAAAPKFVERFAALEKDVENAVSSYVASVKMSTTK
ncbi:MAG: 3-methyl-2-oxobutanoate hydroxymethyltransferase [Elusimicrobia bacterium]|nr:3-methyl-2-oxobutanoate hydroxymethyltransferase [Elusimicrobiota bacterium]